MSEVLTTAPFYLPTSISRDDFVGYLKTKTDRTFFLQNGFESEAIIQIQSAVVKTLIRFPNIHTQTGRVFTWARSEFISEIDNCPNSTTIGSIEYVLCKMLEANRFDDETDEEAFTRLGEHHDYCLSFREPVEN